jgi:hypothetical protein
MGKSNNSVSNQFAADISLPLRKGKEDSLMEISANYISLICVYKKIQPRSNSSAQKPDWSLHDRPIALLSPSSSLPPPSSLFAFIPAQLKFGGMSNTLPFQFLFYLLKTAQF